MEIAGDKPSIRSTSGLSIWPKNWRAYADKVIDNSGDMTSLSDQVEDVWQWAIALPPAADDAGDRVPAS